MSQNSATSDLNEVDAITLSHQFTAKMHRDVYPAISPSNPTNSAKGKNVLITGATRGIGKAIAISWAQAGAASIVITGRTKDLLSEVSIEISRISPQTKVLALTSNAASEEDTAAFWSRVKTEVGLIDVLLCNAGVLTENPAFLPTGKISPSQWWSDMEINILGPYLHIYHFLQQWIAKGEEPSGTVIVLSSGAAGFTIPGFSAYPISKYANLRQVEVLNVEHPQLRAFAVHPGLVQTQMQVEAFLKQSIDTPELTGGLSLYLATEKAEHLRGRYVSVNWDVDEMEEHAAEIREKGLLHTSFLNAKLGPNGHPFEKQIATL